MLPRLRGLMRIRSRIRAASICACTNSAGVARNHLTICADVTGVFLGARMPRTKRTISPWQAFAPSILRPGAL